MMYVLRHKMAYAAVAAALVFPMAFALADKKKENAASDASSVVARVKSVDAAKNSLTVVLASKSGEKRVEEKTFTLGPQVRIGWLTGKGQPPQEARLADIQPGDSVALHLSMDGKEVQSVSLSLPILHGVIRSVRANPGVIVVGRKDKNADTEQEVQVPAQAKILLSDALSKTKQPKEGRLTDLAEGLVVVVRLDKDRTTAQEIQAQGPTIRGMIRGYDAGTRTLTIQVKEEGQPVEKSYRLAANARVEGDLTAGEMVHVRLSVFDRATAVAAVVPKK